MPPEQLSISVSFRPPLFIDCVRPIRIFFSQIIRFAMDSTLNIQKMKSGGVYLPGAGHVDDLYYIFP